MAILEVKNLVTYYKTRMNERVCSVDNVSFSLEEGKSLGIAGESGCGKSTLAMSVMGYYFAPLFYESGKIIIDGKDITSLEPDLIRRTVLGTDIAYIPQAAMNALNPTRKIIRFIEDVLRAHGSELNRSQIYDLARELIRLSGYEPERDIKIEFIGVRPGEKMVEEIVSAWGRLDILVNVAGKSVPPRPTFSDMTLEYWDLVMDRNLRTAVHCCKAVLPQMQKQNQGKIVNLGSTTGLVGVYRFCTAYAASKAAMTAFGKALALEVGEFNINVNTILPGDIDTGDVPWKPGDTARDLGYYSPRLAPPIPRPVRSEEVAELALFLAGDEAKAITGAEYIIDVGVTTVEGMVNDPQ